MTLSKDFLWSAGTSANQHEGAYLEDGKGLSIADCMTKGSLKLLRHVTYRKPDGEIESVPFNQVNAPEGSVFGQFEDYEYPSSVGSDFYHRFKEDIQLLKESGQNAFRMTIAWSRIYPNGYDEKPNEAGLKHYDELFDELKKNHIEPIVMISHYGTPVGLTNKWGSWKDARTIDCYTRYVRTIAERYKGKIHYWLTFSETNVVDMCQFMVAGIPDKTPQIIADATKNIFIASAKAIKILHEIDPENKVGNHVAYGVSYPYVCDPNDVLLAKQAMHERHFHFDVPARGYYPSYKLKEYEREHIHFSLTDEEKELLKNNRVDYLSFSYYNSNTVSADPNLVGDVQGNMSFHGLKNPYLSQSQWGWTIDPVGLRICLIELWERYQLPLMIVGNGLGAQDVISDDGKIHDDYRIDFLKEHIKELKKAVEIDGVELLGYSPWSLLDTLSLSTGERKKRYGLIYVDFDDEGKGTGKRICKDSYEWYKRVALSNGEQLD